MKRERSNMHDLRSLLRWFDREELRDAVDGPNQMSKILVELTPVVSAKPVVFEADGHVSAAWLTEDAGVALVHFRLVVAYRSGFPPFTYGSHVADPSQLPFPIRLGIDRPGLYWVGESDVLTMSSDSWIDASISASDSFGGDHVIVAFGASVFECVCGAGIYFESYPDAESPADVLAEVLAAARTDST